jgi:hypothetical protein
MNTETTLGNEYTSFPQYLYMAIELSLSEWKLGFNIGFGQNPRLRTLTARNLVAFQDEIKAAKKRFDSRPSQTSATPIRAAASEFRSLWLFQCSLFFCKFLTDDPGHFFYSWF